MTKQRRNGKTTTDERPQTAEQPPQSGVQLILILNGQQAGGQFMPLPDTYVQAEQGLSSLFTGLRDTLARLYEDRARQMAAAEHQQVESLSAEVERLKAQLAAAMGETPKPEPTPEAHVSP